MNARVQYRDPLLRSPRPQDGSPASSGPIGRGAWQLWGPRVSRCWRWSGAGWGWGMEVLTAERQAGALSAQDWGTQNRLFHATCGQPLTSQGLAPPGADSRASAGS